MRCLSLSPAPEPIRPRYASASETEANGESQKLTMEQLNHHAKILSAKDKTPSKRRERNSVDNSPKVPQGGPKVGASP